MVRKSQKKELLFESLCVTVNAPVIAAGAFFQTFYLSTMKMSFYFQGCIAVTSMFETVFSLRVQNNMSLAEER